VKTSEAARICHGFVTGCLDLFEAKDPSKDEFFGALYDNMRKLIKLPRNVMGSSGDGGANMKEFMKAAPKIPNNTKLECSDRLITRYRVYEKAMGFLAEHFSTVSPLLSEIKQEYDDIIRICEDECVKRDKSKAEEVQMRKRLGKLVRQMDQAGEWKLCRSEIILHKLLEHDEW